MKTFPLPSDLIAKVVSTISERLVVHIDDSGIETVVYAAKEIGDEADVLLASAVTLEKFVSTHFSEETVAEFLIVDFRQAPHKWANVNLVMEIWQRSYPGKTF